MAGVAKPTAYRISTITTTASINSEIDLDALYDSLDIKEESEANGIAYVEYGVKKQQTVHKGFNKKFLIRRRREKPEKRFDNQLTVIFKEGEATINMKVFRNGNVQMTGVKCVDQGIAQIDKLIGIIAASPAEKKIAASPEKLSKSNFKICLINTDFKAGFEIKRDNLFKVIVGDYDNIVSYEPCIYPGVKMQYFWNSESVEKDGICRCAEKCYLKKKSGDGFGDRNCKKITAAVFGSGSAIITGSQTKDQIDECYAYVNKILYENRDRIEKKQFVAPTRN